MTATTGADARTVTYTTDDQAQIITKGDQRSSFFYGPDKARYKRVDTKISTNASTTTLYLGGVEKIYYPDGQIEWKRNIAGVGQITIKVDANGTEQSRKTHYFHKDHLGSILYISDSTGNIVQEMAYDPWGQRRTVSSPTPLSLSTLQSSYFKVAKPVTQRGFTGHEMIDEVGIIHMNGRIYDAKLGRFMQADPIIQDPTSIASLNRYSYCANNPLNATDPSGLVSIFKKAWDQIRPFVGAIVAIVLTVIFPPAGFWAATMIGAISGAAGAAANGQSILKGAFVGAVTSAAFYGVGHGINWDTAASGQGVFGTDLTKLAFAGKVLAHGTVGGVMSVLQGGKFGHGFAAAGVTQAFSGAIDSIGGGRGADAWGSAGNRALRMVSAATVGGTTSRISGGKFANGAITAAFSRAFNDEASLKKMEAIQEERTRLANMSPKDVAIKMSVESGLKIDGWNDKMLAEKGMLIQERLKNQLDIKQQEYAKMVAGDATTDYKSLGAETGGQASSDFWVGALKAFQAAGSAFGGAVGLWGTYHGNEQFIYSPNYIRGVSYDCGSGGPSSCNVSDVYIGK